MKLIVAALLIGAAAVAQPKIRLVPAARLEIVRGTWLAFDLALTNAGDRKLLFADAAASPGAFEGGVLLGLLEAVLHDGRGNIATEAIVAPAFKFREPARPEIKPREKIRAAAGREGLIDLKEIPAGIYLLVLRLNPDGRRWPPAFFDEAGIDIPIKIIRFMAPGAPAESMLVAKYSAPRPIPARVPPPAWVIAKHRQLVALKPPLPPGAKAAARPRIYRGRGF